MPEIIPFTGKIKGHSFNLTKNVSWGIATTIVQNACYSIFFVILARTYTVFDLSKYIISNNIYGLVLAFSSLGLSQWFLREIQITTDQLELKYKYLKTQFIIGVAFYALNLFLCLLLYHNKMIFLISSIIGLSIIIDNIINVLKVINIHEGKQNRSFMFLNVDAVLKLILGGFLISYGIDMIDLVIYIVLIKTISMLLFFSFGTKDKMSSFVLLKTKTPPAEIKHMIGHNISFVIIGGISVIFWSLGGLLVSKYLEPSDVANYEIIFKIFGLAQIIPVIFSTSVFPLLAKAASNDNNELRFLSNKYSNLYLLYGSISYVFIYSYADILIPTIFGSDYTQAIIYCKEMFLTMIIFPMVLFQANIIIAMKREKIDMLINLLVLVLYITICSIGLNISRRLSIINYGIFISFFTFLIMQDLYLFKLNLKSRMLMTKELVIYIATLVFCFFSKDRLPNSLIFPVYITAFIMVCFPRLFSGNPIHNVISKAIGFIWLKNEDKRV